MNWGIVVAVGIGGFFGAISRFTIASFIQKLSGASFPYGTLAVNIIGSLIIGYLFIFFEQTTYSKGYVCDRIFGSINDIFNILS